MTSWLIGSNSSRYFIPLSCSSLLERVRLHQRLNLYIEAISPSHRNVNYTTFLAKLQIVLIGITWKLRLNLCISDVQVSCIKVSGVGWQKKNEHFYLEAQGSYIPPLWIMCLESVAHLLVIFNVSANFLIYCSVSNQFKAALSKLCIFFCKRVPEGNEGILSLINILT